MNGMKKSRWQLNYRTNGPMRFVAGLQLRRQFPGSESRYTSTFPIHTHGSKSSMFEQFHELEEMQEFSTPADDDTAERLALSPACSFSSCDYVHEVLRDLSAESKERKEKIRSQTGQIG